MKKWLIRRLGLRHSFRWAMRQMEQGKVVHQLESIYGSYGGAPVVFRLAPNKYHVQRTIAVDIGSGFPWKKIPMDLGHIKNTTWRIYTKKFVAKKSCAAEDFGFIDRILLNKEQFPDTYKSKGE